MRSIAIIGALALAAAPLSAQSGKFRSGATIDPSNQPGRLPSTVLGQEQQQQDQRAGQQGNRKSSHVPPGQMPPAGMCRVWIDGVPPGRQPAPTDCQTAVATKPANARVLFGGDGTSFPGKAKGKFDKAKKVKDRDDDNEVRDRTSRGGVLGSVIGGASSGQSYGKKGKNGKGRG